MALWNGVCQVANIAQLTRVMEVAKMVKRNWDACHLLACCVRMIDDLL
jgi:hypothetical protein